MRRGQRARGIWVVLFVAWEGGPWVLRGSYWEREAKCQVTYLTRRGYPALMVSRGAEKILADIRHWNKEVDPDLDPMW